MIYNQTIEQACLVPYQELIKGLAIILNILTIFILKILIYDRMLNTLESANIPVGAAMPSLPASDEEKQRIRS